jgi:DNA (cytosine-5)-methyltransferase 1
MTKPRLLDLFCGAGGAAMGYHRAGFEVVGVDIEPQPFYPFEFHRADVMDLRWDDPTSFFYGWPNDFDAIHASPPCQKYSTMGNRSRAEGNRRLPPAPDLLVPVMDLLAELDLPYVVENVAGAKAMMPNAFILSGGMFGLGVHRPRYFVSNMLILTPAKHKPPPHGIGVYGRAHDGRRLSNRKSNATYRAPRSLEEAQEAMGMDWADWHGTKEAIPPAYTEFIGRQLLKHLSVSHFTSNAQEEQ